MKKFGLLILLFSFILSGCGKDFQFFSQDNKSDWEWRNEGIVNSEVRNELINGGEQSYPYVGDFNSVSFYMGNVHIRNYVFNSNFENERIQRYAIYDLDKKNWLFDCFKKDSIGVVNGESFTGIDNVYYLGIDERIEVSRELTGTCDDKYYEVFDFLNSRNIQDNPLLTGGDEIIQKESNHYELSLQPFESGYLYTYTTAMYEDEHIYYPLSLKFFSKEKLKDEDIVNKRIEENDGVFGLNFSDMKFSNTVSASGQFQVFDIGNRIHIECGSFWLTHWSYMQGVGNFPFEVGKTCSFDMGNYDIEYQNNPFGFLMWKRIGGFWIEKLKSLGEQDGVCLDSLENIPLFKSGYYLGLIQPNNEKFSCGILYSGEVDILKSFFIGDKVRDEKLEKGIFHDVEQGLITVSDGFHEYIIMDKNLGADYAGIGNDSYGCVFQWGNNHCFPWTGEIKKSSQYLKYPEKYGVDNPLDNGVFITPLTRDIQGGSDYWENGGHNANLWGGLRDNGVLIYEDNSARRGPCPEGFHVPEFSELNGLYWTYNNYYWGIGDDLNKHDFSEEVLIPRAGMRDFEYGGAWGGGEIMGLWSSSPTTKAWAIEFEDDGFSEAFYNGISNSLRRGVGLAIRCFKDLGNI